MTVKEASKIRSEAHNWRALADYGFEADEEAAFKIWYDDDLRHREAFAEAELLWSALGAPGFAADLESVADERREYEETQQLPELDRDHGAYRSGALGRFVATAVALAACMVAAVMLDLPAKFFPDEQPYVQEFKTDRGVTRALTLADKSQITLAPGSRLEVVLTDESREARVIEGDAYFDVTSNEARPFLVSTKHLSVTVTGTRFGVQLRPDSASVAVGEGSVQVRANSDYGDASAEGVSLVAGQGVDFETATGLGAIGEVFPAEVASWRSGLLTYSETPLREVVGELNRYSETPIEVASNAADLTISGTFRSNNIEGLLASLEGGMPVKVEHRSDRIHISKR